MLLRRSLSFTPLSAMFLAVLAGCGGQHPVAGACQTVFGGEVCTWGTLAGDRVVAFGATVPMATIENAPPGGEMVFPPRSLASIPLPAEVARVTGYDHLGVNWEPHGHPPALFLTPHFDFHFYTVDPARVAAIDCADQSKPAATPAGYALPDLEIPGMGTLVGLCVPGMGMHSMPAAEVAATEPFAGSLLVGYYQGSLLFLEPMLSEARLRERRSFSIPMPALPAADGRVRWPARFEAVYDSTARAYRLTFTL